MKYVYVYLDNGRLVKRFVERISQLQGSYELVADRAVLDANSILGIYSLDLSKPLLLRIEDTQTENLELLSEFLVE